MVSRFCKTCLTIKETKLSCIFRKLLKHQRKMFCETHKHSSSIGARLQKGGSIAHSATHKMRTRMRIECESLSAVSSRLQLAWVGGPCHNGRRVCNKILGERGCPNASKLGTRAPTFSSWVLGGGCVSFHPVPENDAPQKAGRAMHIVSGLFTPTCAAASSNMYSLLQSTDACKHV